MRLYRFALIAAAVLFSTASAGAQEIDWQKVDAAFGRKAAITADVHRYGFPRTDLTVTLDGVTIKPALALGGWIALKPAHGGAMAMGDLVLLETEINPVMTKLIEDGLEITAIHNHILRGNPATFYMHVGGHGDPMRLATAIRDALAASKTPLDPPTTGAVASAVNLDTAQLDQIIGVKGQTNGGVYQFAVPRRDPIVEGNIQLSPAGPMGVATAIGFQPTGDGKAAITGDFVLTCDEVNPVDQGAAVERHRGDGDSQPHADRAAAADLHALLGERRCAEACQRTAGRNREDGLRKELIERGVH